MSERAVQFVEADHFTYLTPQFLNSFGTLVDELDPQGLWQAQHASLLVYCLEGIDRFYTRLASYLDEEPRSLVTEALLVAFQAHGLTLRKSKDALFFEHPVATAGYLASHRLDASTLAAALLHDVVEDTTVSVSQIVEQFGPDVGKLVDGVTRLQATGKEVISQLHLEEINVESINKLFQFMVDDVRVVLVKLADRRHNMETLAALPRRKQLEKAQEVLQVYAPLAYRLGMWDVKSELEALALKTLHPELYEELVELMERRAQQQQVWLQVIREILMDHFAATGLEVRVEPSPEQVYSLYQEYERDGRLPARLPDVIRIVVLVRQRQECYQVLGDVHRLWKPVPGTFDDYIAHPRENLYRSLHTTVFGPGGLLKIRCRTLDMHQVAHHGILTRWDSEIADQSEGLDQPVQRLLERLKPVGGIEERQDRLAAYREALTDQIQVFTPEADLVELPAGSTPLDFAYQIHTKVGDEARSARINGQLRPLNTVLRSGDQVSIIRISGEAPLREWMDPDLGFVRTAYARNKIRRSFVKMGGDEAVSVGWEALQREMQMMGLEEYDLDEIAGKLGFQGAEELLVAIARAELMPLRVAHVAMEPVWDALEAVSTGGVVLSPDGPVTVRGVPGRPVRLCGACNPVLGDPIVGNLLRGGQVTVHRMDCHHIAHSTQRTSRLNLVEVSWAREPRTARPVHICVAAVDRSGLTHDMTRILEMEQLNICEIYGRTDSKHHVALVTMTVEVTSLRQLSRILHRFGQLPNVKVIRRVSDSPHAQETVMQWAIDSVQNLS